MSLPKKLVASLRQPRFNFFHLVLLILIITLAFFLIDKNNSQTEIQQLRNFLFSTPFPKVQVPVDTRIIKSPHYRQDYIFTTDWFSHNIPVWRQVLANYRGKPDVKYLEIGVYEGRSLFWMLENVLTHDSAHATGIDLFEDSFVNNYASNLHISEHSNKVTAIKGYSQLVLRDLPLNSFDVIYIDGSHAKADTLEDAVLSWRLLKSGGILIFDDYLWAGMYSMETGASPNEFAKPAIDCFLHCFESKYDIIHNSYQMIIKKH